jgi:hypothetical protein
MSRQMMAVTLIAAVLLVVLIPLGLLESRRTPDWQFELSRYLKLSGVSVEDIQHVEVAEAQRPGQFAVQLLQAVLYGGTWQGIDRIPRPDRVRCIRIERQGLAGHGTAPPSISEYLLMGYHSDDLWRAGWIVHQFREGVSEGEQQVLLAKLVCNNWVEISARMLYNPSGGQASSAPNYSFVSPVGQPLIESSSSASYSPCGGFWCENATAYQVYLPVTRKDR